MATEVRVQVLGMEDSDAQELAELIAPSETTRWRRLRGDATYLYRHAKVSADAAGKALRLRFGHRPPRG